MRAAARRPVRRAHRRPRRAVAIAAALTATCALAACVDYLDAGEFGVMRYFGEVRGAAPMRLLPPISDRDGNAYVLYGAPSLAEAAVFVGHPGGSWSAECTLHKGDNRGVHGWVGRSEGRAWYWSGDALVEVTGEDGSCKAILDHDPGTAADVRFLAVIPWVHETPSRRTVVGVVQSPSDPVPYHAVIDLDLGRYTDLEPFQPTTARQVEVLGVGAQRDRGIGVYVVKYLDGQSVKVDAVFVDRTGRVTARASLGGAEGLTQDAVLGELAVSPRGRVVGLLDTGDLLVFDPGGGGVRSTNGFAAAGVHERGGVLWLVGTADGRPVLARLGDDGSIGAAQTWTASQRAADRLRGQVTVLDDRQDPRVYLRWTDPRSAIGPFPFVSPYAPHDYAQDTSLWLVAGPSFDAGAEPRTSVAMAPLGISYP